jgi:hypothetical protein
MQESQQFRSLRFQASVTRARCGAQGVVGLVGSGARIGEQGGQRVATHPVSRFVNLHSPRSPRHMLAMEGGVCAFIILRITRIRAK